MLYAFGRHSAIGYSPMGIDRPETPDKDLTNTYDTIAQLAPVIAEHQGNGTMCAVLLRPDDPPQRIQVGNYTLEVAFLNARRANGEVPSQAPPPPAAAIFIATVKLRNGAVLAGWACLHEMATLLSDHGNPRPPAFLGRVGFNGFDLHRGMEVDRLAGVPATASERLPWQPYRNGYRAAAEVLGRTAGPNHNSLEIWSLSPRPAPGNNPRRFSFQAWPITCRAQGHVLRCVQRPRRSRNGPGPELAVSKGLKRNYTFWIGAMYFKGEPLYPFGFGLSYTTFAYSNLRTSAARLARDGQVTISVNVRNTGKRDGQEVIQLYVKHMGSQVERPIKELKGFQRVALKAGETKTVRMTLQAKDLAYWDAAKKQWVVEDEKVNLMVGGSSADVKVQKTISVNNASM